jgi:hypothetical protein
LFWDGDPKMILKECMKMIEKEQITKILGFINMITPQQENNATLGESMSAMGQCCFHWSSCSTLRGLYSAAK